MISHIRRFEWADHEHARATGAKQPFAVDHPELVGATSAWKSFVEYPLPSLDEIDVLFKSDDECVGVEVKSAISDAYPADYERGLYQTIKYRALLTAMTHDKRYAMPSNIRVVLVLESQLPLEYKTTAEVLGVEVIENVRVHPNQAITQASTGS